MPWAMTATMSHPRVLVRLAAGAGLRLVVHYRGDDRAERFVNAVIDVDAGERSELQIYRLQQQGAAAASRSSAIEAALARDARLVVRDASSAGRSRGWTSRARLAGSGASAELTGRLPRRRRPAPRHAAARRARAPATRPACRTIAASPADRGRGVFNGKVVVNEGAQKSDAARSSRNLLLTPGAEIDTKPELEIYADDVQCSHGATTGQLDPAALFYLRSRGLDERDARSALTRAFAAPVLSRIDLAPFASAVHDGARSHGCVRLLAEAA